MTRQSKKRVLLAGGAALVCAIAVLLFHIPGSIPYFDGEDHTYTQVVLRQGDAYQRREVTIDDPETVAATAPRFITASPLPWCWKGRRAPGRSGFPPMAW